jgi:RNA polymerase sigma-70 factor (ECF subfamily)
MVSAFNIAIWTPPVKTIPAQPGNPLPAGCIYITTIPFVFYMNLSELVKEAKQGSTAAQQCLFDRLSGRMLLLCRRYVKNEENAEEVLLDGFYKFFKGLAAFSWEGEAALYAWIKRIMINECLMLLRKKNVFTITTEPAEGEMTLDEDALDKLSAEEIFRLVAQLPVGYRTVFNLYAIEGAGHKEIAALLDISEGTSKSQLSKARSLLQKMLIQKGTVYVKRKAH